MVTLQFKQLSVPPGQRVLFLDVSWQDFEAILAELGEHRGREWLIFKEFWRLGCLYQNMNLIKKLLGIW